MRQIRKDIENLTAGRKCFQINLQTQSERFTRVPPTDREGVEICAIRLVLVLPETEEQVTKHIDVVMFGGRLYKFPVRVP